MLQLAVDMLIADLAALAAPPDAENIYAAAGPPGNAVRRRNLTLALGLALARGPDLLLVGEAPGHAGARRTGVPFTSERLLLAGLGPFGRCDPGAGFTLAGDDGRISAEATATIVWRELAAVGLVAAGWNAYPLHPHRPGAPQSNRRPRAAELALGQPLLAQVCAMFPGVSVVAVGDVAAAALAALGVAHVSVRHPARGGARQFAAGLRALAAGRNPGAEALKCRVFGG